jgi:hypothetical protein
LTSRTAWTQFGKALLSLVRRMLAIAKQETTIARSEEATSRAPCDHQEQNVR